MRRLLLIAVILVVIVGVVGLSWVTRATPHVRDRVVAALNQRFASQVGLETLQVSVYPRPELAGTGLTLRHNGRTDVPPLITIQDFQSGASLFGLLGKPMHLRNVTLGRLEIHIPPGGLHGAPAPDGGEPPPGATVPATPSSPSTVPNTAPITKAVSTTGSSDNMISMLLIDEIISNQARLEIATTKPGKLPRVFDIDHLVLTGFGRPEGAKFQAGLINPVPRGRIETGGNFGPWNAADPQLTPVRGEYSFKDANLDTIKGIGGILSSVGSYKGVLERIEVEGQTETPDFQIDIAGQKVPLSTRFKAVVDGTNGDTLLERVEARLAESTIVASGAVVRTEDVKGRKVSLDIRIDRARLEDLLRLAIKTPRPPLTGRVDVLAKFLLPQGEADVIDRLRLDGQFNLAQAKFANLDVQKKINILSRRGKGDEQSDGSGESVVSNLRGRFVMRNAQLDFQELQFAVPGAVVQLAGTYNLHAETIDFSGDLLLDATLADMTTGFKSVLARLAQPFFKREGGGSRVPIKITGTRGNPTFGLDRSRVFRRGDKSKS